MLKARKYAGRFRAMADQPRLVLPLRAMARPHSPAWGNCQRRKPPGGFCSSSGMRTGRTRNARSGINMLHPLRQTFTPWMPGTRFSCENAKSVKYVLLERLGKSDLTADLAGWLKALGRLQDGWLDWSFDVCSEGTPNADDRGQPLLSERLREIEGFCASQDPEIQIGVLPAFFDGPERRRTRRRCFGCSTIRLRNWRLIRGTEPVCLGQPRGSSST